jgi:hypothetical protein
VLYKLRHQAPSVISGAPIDETPSQKSKHTHTAGDEDKDVSRSGSKGNNWHKEVPLVCWALCTNVNRATRDTILHLVYGADAVLPPKIFLEATRVTQFNEEYQNEARELDSNRLEEQHNKALANVQKYQNP